MVELVVLTLSKNYLYLILGTLQMIFKWLGFLPSANILDIQFLRSVFKQVYISETRYTIFCFEISFCASNFNCFPALKQKKAKAKKENSDIFDCLHWKRMKLDRVYVVYCVRVYTYRNRIWYIANANSTLKATSQRFNSYDPVECRLGIG